VDGNSVCVAECQEGGLNVVHDDILSFLQKSGEASFGAVTLFQVFEHLPFGVLVEVLREIHRVLTPGGVLIAEIPNSKNVRVGSGTFWIDPTHERPLFPDVLMFLAEQVGFDKVDGKYVNRLGPQHDLSGLPEGATQALTSILDALDGPGDFALIAKR
jgi:O-antigen chain-terminating methyltransferase